MAIKTMMIHSSLSILLFHKILRVHSCASIADHDHSRVSLSGWQLHATPRTTQSLHSMHNLHTVYEELTELECVSVRVTARESAETFHHEYLGHSMMHQGHSLEGAHIG